MLAGTILPIGSRCQKSAHNLVTGNLHKTDSALCKLFTVSTFSTAKQNPLSVQVSLIRILKPDVLLPATTALGTIDPLGREKGVQAGANVVMPNLSPTNVRKKYELYDNKICTGDEAAECRYCLNRRMETIGCELATDRGDAPGWEHR